jgi:hypothetical protein
VSVQRRKGELAKVWKTITTVDRRGNVNVSADEVGPHEVRAVFVPQRSARAEVPGQQQINILRMIVAPDLTDVNLWSRVEYRGRMWDVVTPPAYHHGVRQTRHWSIDLRERPGG